MCGPYIVRLSTNHKLTTKVWVLIYLCDQSKALHIEIVEDYSGPGLVKALKQAFAVRNTPSQITTDPGKNFVRARTLLSHPNSGSGLSKEDLATVQATFPAIKWNILPPGSPWRNGGPEAMVKQVKYSIRLLPTNQLGMLEFCCVLMEITATINNRPLGVCTATDQPLTPNQLLLGRNFDSVPPLYNHEELSLSGLRSYVVEVFRS
jgi:hypothetical protein